ncbi:MAG: hypothetical protein R3C68_02165 [Myxococcota bacterium]
MQQAMSGCAMKRGNINERTAVARWLHRRMGMSDRDAMVVLLTRMILAV